MFATKILRAGEYKGIRVASRYDLETEVATMAKVIDQLPSYVSARMRSIFCDSKASALYTVEADPTQPISEIGDEVAAALKAVDGGFNGIVVQGNGEEEFIEPWWPESDDA